MQRGRRHTMLRDATASRHAALDAAVSGASYFASVAAYRGYLSRQFAFHQRFDPSARACDPALFSRWQTDELAALLADDIAALGLERTTRPATCGEDFDLPSRAHLTGALYVVIGSSLGSRIIFNWALELGPEAERALGYLRHMATTRVWASFVPFLEQEPLDDTALVAGATATFALAHACLAPEAAA